MVGKTYKFNVEENDKIVELVEKGLEQNVNVKVTNNAGATNLTLVNVEAESIDDFRKFNESLSFRPTESC